MTATRARLRTTAFMDILGSLLGWRSLATHGNLPGIREPEGRFSACSPVLLFELTEAQSQPDI